ncbi:MAG: GTP-binding protein ychf [Candidatus Berkelbacteria bacterium Licking1014_7]|uniref:GTP-binding protein ychf n=1 Tax=Candidatus Berkelbacteria bacterium Licking1014_7 TaxID=2017147 RepID=A0A554LHJ9_9BACT|nr:MAG: GTP-binding protein ychf [Candidatus Berkelbacteria bacterium Licking1014_7]
MSISIGLVGLPSTGKSTLFNALLQKYQAEVAAFNFTTINPNIGIVEIPDPRLEKIAQIAKSKKITYSTLKIFDIAGLIRGAHQGAGLGNQFLSEINRVDLIALVIRFFENENVPHPENNLHPGNDLKTLLNELMLKDLETLDKAIFRLQKDLKLNQNVNYTKETLKIIEKIKLTLESEQIPNISQEEIDKIKEIPLLTIKPFIFIANCSQAQIIEADELITNFCPKIPLKNWVIIDALNEQEIIDFAKSEKQEIREAMGMRQSGIDALLQISFEKLKLINYFTARAKEARAWQIPLGTNARQSSQKIHNDFFQKFIRAKVISYENYLSCEGEQKAKEKGLIRTEGEHYIVKDGDVIEFVLNK